MGLDGLSETTLFWIDILALIGFIIVCVLIVKVAIKIIQNQMMTYYKQEKRKEEIFNVFNDLKIGDNFNEIEKKFMNLDFSLKLIREEQIFNGVYRTYKIPLDWKYSTSSIKTKGTVITQGLQDSRIMHVADTSYIFSTSNINSVVDTNSETLKDAVIFLSFENNQLVLKDQEGLD